MGVICVIVILLRAFLLPGAALAAENLALRQQLAVLQVSMKRVATENVIRLSQGDQCSIRRRGVSRWPAPQNLIQVL